MVRDNSFLPAFTISLSTFGFQIKELFPPISTEPAPLAHMILQYLGSLAFVSAAKIWTTVFVEHGIPPLLPLHLQIGADFVLRSARLLHRRFLLARTIVFRGLPARASVVPALQGTASMVFGVVVGWR